MDRKLRFIQGVFGRPEAVKIPRHRGFSLLELVIVITIISFLMVFAIDRVLAMKVDAERVAMDTVIGTLKSAVGIKVAEIVVKNDMAAFKALEGSNPIDRLAEVPANYLGEMDSPDPTTIEPGNWYFERSSKALVYVPQHVDYFAGGLANPPRARFAIKLIYADKNKNGAWDPGTEIIEGVRLATLEPYRWTKEVGEGFN